MIDVKSFLLKYAKLAASPEYPQFTDVYPEMRGRARVSTLTNPAPRISQKTAVRKPAIPATPAIKPISNKVDNPTYYTVDNAPEDISNYVLLSDLDDAMRFQESRNNPNAKGDFDRVTGLPKAHGYYQIHKEAWADAGGDMSRYPQDASNLDISRRIAWDYQRRYYKPYKAIPKDIWYGPKDKVLIRKDIADGGFRVYNGGPGGLNNENARIYAAKAIQRAKENALKRKQRSLNTR